MSATTTTSNLAWPQPWVGQTNSHGVGKASPHFWRPPPAPWPALLPTVIPFCRPCTLYSHTSWARCQLASPEAAAAPLAISSRQKTTSPPATTSEGILGFNCSVEIAHIETER